MKHCPICNSVFSTFLPLPLNYYQIFNQVGSNFALDNFETLNCAQYSCPHCGASDRERLLALYMLGMNLLTPATRVLEIAPSPTMINFFARSGVNYRSADLYSPLAQDKVDITDMYQYADGSFDLVLCSHVLEHVPDDTRAMRELARVLSDNGTLLTLVPLPLGLEKTDEDPAVTDITERWQRFGQDDHIRMYAKQDFVARLETSGLSTSQVGIEEFGAEHFTSAGISPSSVLYACKPRRA